MIFNLFSHIPFRDQTNYHGRSNKRHKRFRNLVLIDRHDNSSFQYYMPSKRERGRERDREVKGVERERLYICVDVVPVDVRLEDVVGQLHRLLRGQGSLRPANGILKNIHKDTCIICCI